MSLWLAFFRLRSRGNPATVGVGLRSGSNRISSAVTSPPLHTDCVIARAFAETGVSFARR
jgi:hypothetical protein